MLFTYLIHSFKQNTAGQQWRVVVVRAASAEGDKLLQPPEDSAGFSLSFSFKHFFC